MVNVSVVMCSNLIDEFFDLSIQSLVGQDFKEMEIIVVLNGDARHDLDLLKSRYSHIGNIQFFATDIKFLNYSLNVGIDRAIGKYIARMDSDDISYPSRITTQYQFMESNPGLTVCGSWYDLLDDRGNVIRQVQTSAENKKIKRELVFGNPFCHPTTMFRRNAVVNVGAYLNALYAEDYDLWVRLSHDPRHRFANIPQSLLGYRSSPTGLARKSKLAYHSVSAVQWTYFLKLKNPLWLIASIYTALKGLLLGR